MSADGNDGRFVVHIRGLPWSSSEAEILNFFANVNIVNGEEGIHKTFTREGRPSGEAYIEVHSDPDLQNAVAKGQKWMRGCYIEVFKSTAKEMEHVLGRNRSGMVEQYSEGAVSYLWPKEEMARCFLDRETRPNRIYLSMSDGRCNGKAYVQFANQAISEQALSMRKQEIGHRHIEIRPAQSNARWGPYDRPVGGSGRGPPRGSGGYEGGRLGGSSMEGYRDGGGGNYYNDYDDYHSWSHGTEGGYGPRRREPKWDCRCRSLYWYDYGNGANNRFTVRMRGLPFRATSDDVSNFFSPVVPVHVDLEYGKDGRLSGEANVDFASYQDAQSAMSKDMTMMQHRYIELFLRCNGNGGDGGSRLAGYGSGRSGGGGYDYGGSRGYGYENYANYRMKGGNYKQF